MVLAGIKQIELGTVASLKIIIAMGILLQRVVRGMQYGMQNFYESIFKVFCQNTSGRQNLNCSSLEGQSLGSI